MSNLEKNNNVYSSRKPKTTSSKNAERPRPSEYNLPLVLTDATRDPPRTFQRGNLLGTGGFAKVFQVTDASTGVNYADKVISKAMFARRNSAKHKVEREISLHRKMKHENIVSFHSFFEDAKYVHLLLELAPQKTLLHVSKYRRLVSECEVRYYTKQIMAGTSYIHSKQVLHRDLKLGNMFLSYNMIVKIGDFGLATSFSDNQPGSLCGTPNYIAPEVLAKAGHSVSSEVWSIGCMVYAMLCGTPPFETESVTSTYQLISNCDYKIPQHLSMLASQFIQSMLTHDPTMRGCLGDPPPSSIGTNLQDHSFLVEGFSPSCLPSSALTTTPVFTDKFTVRDEDSVTADIPAVETSEDNTGCGSFSPSKSLGSSLRKMLGLFSSKDKFLDQAIVGLSTCLASRTTDYEAPINLMVTPVFISKWVDYSNKFGFGFQMSDGCVGVMFNDSTKIGTTSDSAIVEFTDMKGKTFSFPWEDDTNQPFPELNHRVSLLKYYIQYMEENLADSVPFLSGMETISTRQKTAVPQLRRWGRRGDSVAMELNTQLVQVNHITDHVKVIIWVYNGDLLVSLMSTNINKTISLSSPCPPAFRSRLKDTLQEVKEMAFTKASEVIT
eukprot:GFUD01021463.1.p1 GENE.GFUD01021463.1~~GFUD01021463.1.p1  ORF type:complete len:609 (-),score=163.29 GFUD01021463.1:98-1924(-)